MPSAHQYLPKTNNQIGKILNDTYIYAITPNTWSLASSIAATFTTIAPTTFDDTTSVVLTGTGFTGATDVNFNGVAASSFVVDSDTQITATPAPVMSSTETLITITLLSGAIVVGPTLCTQNVGAGPGTLDADTVVAAIQAVGTLTAPQETAVRNRIQAFYDDGIAADMFAYYGCAGGTAASHAINWVDPGTNDITWVGTGAIHSAAGMEGRFNAANYGNFGFAPSDLPQSSVTVFQYMISSSTANYQFLYGSSQNGAAPFNVFGLSAHDTNQQNARLNMEDDLIAHRIVNSSGYNSAIRPNSTTLRLRNNAETITPTITEVSSPNRPIYLFSLNFGGTSSFPSNQTISSIGFASRGFTSTEDDDNRFSEIAYQTAMGR